MPRSLPLAMLLAVAALLAPASAAARVLPAGNIASFELGHGLSVITYGGHATAISDREETMTSYEARGRTGTTGMVARFGELGRIDVDFEPSGRPTRQKTGPYCRGGPQLTWKGVFTGTVELRGRFGFRSFRDRSFTKTGSLAHTPRLVCDESRESKPPPTRAGNGVLLWAGSCDGRGISIQSERPSAIRDPDPERSIRYSAWARVRDGGVQIEQLLNLPAAPETFSFDEALTTATVSPPAPFHGIGTLVRGPDGTTSWVGSLSANLLGKHVPLAGPRFDSRLVSFPIGPNSIYVFSVSPDCGVGEAAASNIRWSNPLHRAHLGALLPSGAR